LKPIFSWPVRVYYEDTDAGGVVYHANYLKFYERARTEMLRALGFQQDQLITEQQLIFVVSGLEIKYRSPARFNEQLQVTATINQVRPVRLVFEQQITRADDVLSTAMVTVASLDPVSMRPKKIPEDLLIKLQ
jgi:acyl-CoA thioester hydrolase